ncbi:hypothetical protein E8E11_001924 [Didymella keratinophila]|nr:hypothetical protein E8E11_001924 [Didymella keratinophila]
MLGSNFTKKQRLYFTIVISFSFFITELVVGFITHSLALVADAFHYLSDLIGIVVALLAVLMEEREAPDKYTFGYQRASLIGAFFNGVFLLALSVSIFVQAIERFTDISEVKNPKLVLIVGCVGFGLNVLVMSFLHALSMTAAMAMIMGTSSPTSPTHKEHKHNTAVVKPSGRDLGMLGVLIHVLGDAINNIGVIISAVVIWQASGHGRYYIDPAISCFIAIMILISAIPLTKSSGSILLQIAPGGVETDHIPGVESVHELHIWRLDQRKTIASAHLVLTDEAAQDFANKAKIIMECLHAYGIHSATLQPETMISPNMITDEAAEVHSTAVEDDSNYVRRRKGAQEGTIRAYS